MGNAWFLLVLMAIIHMPAAARTLSHLASHHQQTHDHSSNFTFFMVDVFGGTHHPAARPSSMGIGSTQLPFPKPLGLFPPAGGIPLPESNPPIAGLPAQTPDLSSIGLFFFPAAATLQELQFGAAVTFDEDFHSTSSSTSLLGKAQGLHVVSSDDGSSHMMAMAASFASSEFRDSLQFFGVHRTSNDAVESHIAVIGGTGKLDGANGYATIKVFAKDSNMAGNESEAALKKFLLFHVYLS